MSPTVVFIIVFMVLIYGGIFYFTAQKRKKLKEAMGNTDWRTEAAKAPGYSQELLQKEYPFLQKQLDGATVEAFTTAQVEYTAKDQAKDIAKDALKSIATLGTVKFTTVQTPKYLALSGDDLHLIDTDTDGNISKHLIFDKFRLQNSSIAEVPLTKTESAAAKYTGTLPKRYRISLETDGKNLAIDIYDTLMHSGNGMANAFGSADGQIKRYVVGSYFLKKLGEKVANLKTKTVLPE